MLRFKHHFMRIFAVLLATVFIANTVYASSMMVSASFKQSRSNDVYSHEHKHGETGDMIHAHAQYHQHKTANSNHDVHNAASHHNCKQCNHCLACFSILMPDLVEIAASTNQPVLAISSTSLYLSHVSPLLQRPPIA